MAREIVPEDIWRYCEEHSGREDDLLRELERTTFLKAVHPQMISGKLQGRLLGMISMLMQPESILEIGTFTGYSAYCLAKGLVSGGKLTTIEVNEELEPMVREFFSRAGISDRVSFVVGDALELLPEMKQRFDLIFLDANKEQYPDYLRHCKARLKSGGLLIADNTLWGGKVTAPQDADESAQQLDRFNKALHSDPGFETVLLPVRDGLTLARKTAEG